MDHRQLNQAGEVSSRRLALRRLSHGVALLAMLGAALAACGGDDETALVIEVTSAVPAASLDVVTFRVQGPGVEAGRIAEASLVGPEAKRFPLQLTLIHAGGAMGPFLVSVEGRLSGQMRARAEGTMPLNFQPKRTLVHHYVLKSVDGSADERPDGGGATTPPGGTTIVIGGPASATDGGSTSPSTPSADAGAGRDTGPMMTGAGTGNSGTGNATGGSGGNRSGGATSGAGGTPNPGSGGASGGSGMGSGTGGLVIVIGGGNGNAGANGNANGNGNGNAGGTGNGGGNGNAGANGAAEQEKAEQEKAEKEKAEQEKAEKEKAEKEKAEKEKAEKEKP